MAALRILLLLLVCSGCTSTTSTMLNRLDSDLFVGNSNGKPGVHEQTRPFKGVPITVRVPTHVDVAIREKVRLFVDGSKLHVVHSSKPHLFVTTEVIYTDKVFTVDPKRPAAGSLDYTMQFGDRTDASDDSQYFKQITSTIQDETLQDITAALNTVVSAVSTSGGGNRQSVVSDTDAPKMGHVSEERTVAWRRFDIDALDFEHQVVCFVEQHMGQCDAGVIYRSSDGTAEHSAEATALLDPLPHASSGYGEGSEPIRLNVPMPPASHE